MRSRPQAAPLFEEAKRRSDALKGRATTGSTREAGGGGGNKPDGGGATDAPKRGARGVPPSKPAAAPSKPGPKAPAPADGAGARDAAERKRDR